MMKNIPLSPEAIKLYRPDIAAVILIALLAVIFAGRPAMNLAAPPAAKAAVEKPPAEAVQETKSDQRPVESDQAIRQRNIFAASGAYTESAGQPLPDNPYALIAVLKGKERKAVFRGHTGDIVTLSVGKEMIDGFVIARIDNLSVLLKKRDEQKELRLFNADGNLPPPAVDKAGTQPANLYTLIGILGGKEKKAAFRDYKGSIAILGVGAKLIDGAVITAIDSVSVKLKKENENSELKIFDFHKTEQALRKK